MNESKCDAMVYGAKQTVTLFQCAGDPKQLCLSAEVMAAVLTAAFSAGQLSGATQMRAIYERRPV